MSKKDTAMYAFKICLSEQNIAKNASDVLLDLITTVLGLETALERGINAYSFGFYFSNLQKSLLPSIK